MQLHALPLTRGGTIRATALLLAALSLAAPLARAAPLTVHAAVLSDPNDGEVGLIAADKVSTLLRSSAGYDTIDNGVLEGRLGEGPDKLFRRCWNDVGCWRSAGLDGGVEQIVLVEVVAEHTLGLRVVDVVGRGPIRMGTFLQVNGRPDPKALDRFFFEPGSLVLSDLPPGARLLLDGRFEFDPEGTLELTPLASGKHSLEIEAPRHAPLFATVMVYPNQQTQVSGRLPQLQRSRGRMARWTTLWAVGLVATGAAGLTTALLAEGEALPAD